VSTEHEADGREQSDIVSLHRYFIWCDRMRVHFHQVLEEHGADCALGSRGYIENTLYMSYWYGGLYVVVEGWRELGLSDPEVDRLLASPNVDLLRRYRNGAFHYQSDYFDSRFVDFVSEKGTAGWIRELREALSSFFLRWVQRRGQASSDLTET